MPALAERTLEVVQSTVMWECGDRRRAVVGRDWLDAKEVFRRVLERLPGGGGQYLNVQSQFSGARSPGGVLELRLGAHTVGLVRPYAPEPIETDAPVLILANVGGKLTFPLLLNGAEPDRELVRRLDRERGYPVRAWRKFDAEFAPEPLNAFFAALSDGSVVVRTVLEDELRIALGEGSLRF